MKDQKKAKDVEKVEYLCGLRLTLDESLDRFLGPEFTPPKFKELQERLKKVAVQK